MARVKILAISLAQNWAPPITTTLLPATRPSLIATGVATSRRHWRRSKHSHLPVALRHFAASRRRQRLANSVQRAAEQLQLLSSGYPAAQ